MAQIGTLTAGVGVQSVIAGQSQCEQYLLINTVDSTNQLLGIQVEVDGITFINISGNAALISAYAKWQSEACGPGVGSLIKLATGSIKKNTTIRLTNSAAFAAVVYGFSESQNGVPLMATTKTVNASSYEDFSSFSALLVQTPANIASIEILFADGRKSTLSAAEAAALFNLYNTTDAGGLLNGVLVIDNSRQTIKSVRINMSAANVVLLVKLPDEAFKILAGKN
jgi:hypothetical protein